MDIMFRWFVLNKIISFDTSLSQGHIFITKQKIAAVNHSADNWDRIVYLTLKFSAKSPVQS